MAGPAVTWATPGRLSHPRPGVVLMLRDVLTGMSDAGQTVGHSIARMPTFRQGT